MSCAIYRRSPSPAFRRRLGSHSVFTPSLFSADLFDALSVWPSFESDFEVVKRSATVTPRADIRENDKGFHVAVEVPGIPQSDISISLDRGLLKITGKTRSRSTEPSASDETAQESEQDNTHREGQEESAVTSTRRSFALSYKLGGRGVVLDEANIQAKLENGLLEITLPKVSPPQPKTIPIQCGVSSQAPSQPQASTSDTITSDADANQEQLEQ